MLTIINKSYGEVVYAGCDSWHDELAWLRSGDSSTNILANLDHVEQLFMIQPTSLKDFCTPVLKSSSGSAAIVLLQKVMTAVARLSLRQRMHLIFTAYKARFAEIGVVTTGALC